MDYLKLYPLKIVLYCYPSGSLLSATSVPVYLQIGVQTRLDFFLPHSVGQMQLLRLLVGVEGEEAMQWESVLELM